MNVDRIHSIASRFIFVFVLGSKVGYGSRGVFSMYTEYIWSDPVHSNGVDCWNCWMARSLHHCLYVLLLCKCLLWIWDWPGGDWVNAMSISSYGLRLDKDTVRVGIGLRLGVNLCAPYTCPCDNLVNALGTQELSCRWSTGGICRHNIVLNNIVSEPVPEVLASKNWSKSTKRDTLD